MQNRVSADLHRQLRPQPESPDQLVNLPFPCQRPSHEGQVTLRDSNLHGRICWVHWPGVDETPSSQQVTCQMPRGADKPGRGQPLPYSALRLCEVQAHLIPNLPMFMPRPLPGVKGAGGMWAFPHLPTLPLVEGGNGSRAGGWSMVDSRPRGWGVGFQEHLPGRWGGNSRLHHVLAEALSPPPPTPCSIVPSDSTYKTQR